MQPSNFMTPGRLKYKTGDATVPESAGHRLIIHVCNNEGKWGAGFVLAVSKRWIKPEQEYRRWFRSRNMFKLGEIQEVGVQSDTIIINMVAQDGVYQKPDGTPPIDYDALEQCLDKVGELAVREGSSIHMPRIACGLAGGSWDKVEPLIIERIIKRGVNVIHLQNLLYLCTLKIFLNINHSMVAGKPMPF